LNVGAIYIAPMSSYFLAQKDFDLVITAMNRGRRSRHDGGFFAMAVSRMRRA